MEKNGIQEHSNDLHDNYDRNKELRAFDETKTGVKGIVDSGTKTLPKMFIRPADELLEEQNISCVKHHQVPVISLDGIQTNDCCRKRIIQQVLSASMKWGFFQVLDHGIPVRDLEAMLEGIRMFHEQDDEDCKLEG
ncbi:hypothetical protein RND81_05G067400 [Saponaria officinalis]|uniref:Non-haem dioxygenase N-terminal domain-containing protein n=1 Tax=Saponaria officinalis TaxID=3572 RepID=A0AAW1KV66_SAPOF